MTFHQLHGTITLNLKFCCFKKSFFTYYSDFYFTNWLTASVCVNVVTAQFKNLKHNYHFKLSLF